LMLRCVHMIPLPIDGRLSHQIGCTCTSLRYSLFNRSSNFKDIPNFLVLHYAYLIDHNQHINFRTELSLFFLLYTLLTSSNMYEYIEYVDNNRHREKVQLPDVKLTNALSLPGNNPDGFPHVFTMSYFKT
jgi:hypothetical protein